MLCILWIKRYTCLHNIPYIIVLANTYVSSSQWCRHVFVSDMLVVNNGVEHVNRLEVCQLPCLLVKQFTRQVIIHNPLQSNHFKKEETEKTPCMQMQMPCQAHAMPCEMEQTHLHTTPWTNDNQMDWIINVSNQSFSGRWEGKESVACTILEPKVATRCAGIRSMLCILYMNGYTCLHNIPYTHMLAHYIYMTPDSI